MDKTQFNPQDPNALFSPDQWLNRFSNYNNAPLPWPSTFYTGTPAGSMPPTDAMGKPIQSFLDMQAKHDAWRPPASAPGAGAPMGTDPNFGMENMWLAANHQPIQLAPTRTPGQLGPQTQEALQAMNAASQAAGAQGAQAVPGTTLNSTPQNSMPGLSMGSSPNMAQGSGLEAAGSQARAMQNAGYGDWAMLDPMMAQTNRPNPTADAGTVGATTGWNPANPASRYPTSPGQAGQGGGGQQQNPFDMHQAYLDALSRPQGDRGLVTPGATVPAGPSAQPGPGALQAFLQNWKPAQAGPGSGFQQGFGKTLRGMGY